MITTVSENDDLIFSLAIQTDDKLVVAGYSTNNGNFYDFLLVRYNSDGSLDTSFDTDGIVITDFSLRDYGRAVLIQPDGKIIVTGDTAHSVMMNLYFDFAVARYNSDGSLDTSFDTDGKVTTDLGSYWDETCCIALQSDNKIVVAGQTWNGNDYDLALTRYNGDGSVDNNFGTDGRVITPVGNNDDLGSGVGIQPDGKILVAGASNNSYNYDFALVRHNADGSLDTNFHADGKVTTPIGSGHDYGSALAIQADGKIIVNGSTVSNDTSDFALVRYIPDVITSSFRSVDTNDGWILESTETSGNGGSTNSAASTLNLGDNATKRQYRSILSFNTSSLPDNAVITKVTLKLKRQGVAGGGNPVTMFQGFVVDIKKGTLGTPALALGDFKVTASKTYGPFNTTLTGGWYNLNLTPGKNYINKLGTNSGLTQIRVRFKLDDNNNAIANYLKIYSGNAPAASRPQLIIEYYVP